MAKDNMQDLAFQTLAQAQLLDDDTEMQKHVNAILSLSTQMEMPVDMVSSLYSESLENYYSKASIKDFLPVLISRQVRQRLRRRAS